MTHRGKDGRTYRYLRFTAYGKRRRVAVGAVAARAAEAELRHVLADVERGNWQPPQPVEPPPEQPSVPTFHQLAEQWWKLNVEGQLAYSTQAGYRWRLEVHLLPYFGEMRINEITIDKVDRYRAAKLSEHKPLSPRSINMTLTLLAAIMESALERELIGRNSARGRKRRVRERGAARSYLDTAWQIEALLDGAGELDQEAREDPQHVERRVMVATLVFAGLRIGELCSLRERDVDLAGGWLTVGQSKTDAGRRRVKIRGALRDELLALRGRRGSISQDAYLFPTARGARMSDDNFRSRVLGRPAVVVHEQEKRGKGAIGRANKLLEARGLPPLPAKLTPHSLRRTFCSILYALGESPPVVMQEMGHTNPALALRVYAQAMRRDEDEERALRALVEGESLSPEGIAAEDSQAVA
jgi:integrase